jgi:hypothetical protein
MTENASLSDYLFELRQHATPARLGMAIGAGAVTAAAGLVLGPRFTAMTGLGLAVAGVCAWARVGQMTDAMMDGSFGAQLPERARRLRALGVAALGIGALGALLFFYSLAIRFLSGSTGM